MENRLSTIYDAASHLFINRGYGQTQIKDIAKRIGLSTGMLYVYFAGKRDILNLVLKGTIEPSFLEREFGFPIESGLFSSLNAEIKEAFEDNAERFAAHEGAVGDYPLELMLSDAFDVVSRYGVGCLIIEKNPDDVGDLADFYRRYRRTFFDQLLSYVRIYIELGRFREVEYPEYCANLIVETLSWWGMHVMNDAFEVRKDIPLAVAKSVCLDNLLHAYGC